MTALPPITGRCYCGSSQIVATSWPQIVAYCHCDSCRRLSGAPVAALAAFKTGDVDITPVWPSPHSVTHGVNRWFCKDCGSALAATYDYLPDQTYVPIGVLDQANQLPPQVHSHFDSALSWFHTSDDLPKNRASSKDDLLTSPASARLQP